MWCSGLAFKEKDGWIDRYIMDGWAQILRNKNETYGRFDDADG